MFTLSSLLAPKPTLPDRGKIPGHVLARLLWEWARPECPLCGIDVLNPDGCEAQDANGARMHVPPTFWGYRAWYVHSGSPRALRVMTDLLTPDVVDALDRAELATAGGAR